MVKPGTKFDRMIRKVDNEIASSVMAEVRAEQRRVREVIIREDSEQLRAALQRQLLVTSGVGGGGP